jgi:hypothetical protein
MATYEVKIQYTVFTDSELNAEYVSDNFIRELHDREFVYDESGGHAPIYRGTVIVTNGVQHQRLVQIVQASLDAADTSNIIDINSRVAERRGEITVDLADPPDCPDGFIAVGDDNIIWGQGTTARSALKEAYYNYWNADAQNDDVPLFTVHRARSAARGGSST